MALDATFMDRVRSVPWGNYAGSCGNGTTGIPSLFAQLVAGESSNARAAASGLWNVLSHQGNVDAVAVPALPFLLEALDAVPEEVAVEVMDILACFAGCARGFRRYPPPSGEPSWVVDLRAGLVAERQQFLRLAEHRNEDIAGFAAEVVEVDNPEWLGQGVRGWGP